MNASEAIQEIRNKTNDREGIGDLDNDEILSYLNEAIAFLSAFFISAGNPFAIKEIDIVDGDTLPADFTKTAGTFPMKITGRKVALFNKRKPLKVRYFAELLPLKTEDDVMPFEMQSLNMVLVKLAVIYVFNQQRFNVQQDQAITTELMNIINSALGYSA